MSSLSKYGFKKRKAVKQRSSRKAKKQSIYANVVKIPRTMSVSPFYGTKRVVHRYASPAYALAHATTAAGVGVFSANGLYDPDISGVGQQPLGFDQMSAMYHRYTVINAQIRVVFSGTTTETRKHIVGVTALRSTSVQSRKYYMEGHSSWDILPQSNITDDTREVMLSVSIPQFFGVTKIMSEKDLSGTASNNPIQQLYFHVWAADEVSGTGNVIATIEIAYTAIWHEPETVTTS